MGSLYECLREARLDKFYPTLRANGFSSAESLLEATSEDIAALGASSSDELRRLYELVDIIRSVYEADVDDLPDVRDIPEVTAYSISIPVNRQSQTNKKPARKRNRSPAAYGASNVIPRIISSANRGAQRQQANRHVSSSATRANSIDQQQLAGAAVYSENSDSSNEDGGHSDSSGPSDYEPATKHSNRTSATPPQSRKTATVERVKHTAGYNYGLPRNKVRQKFEISRSRTSEDKIRVCIRKRPRNRRETRSGDDDVVAVECSDTITVNEPKLALDLTAYTLQHEFRFDEVFHEGCGNEEVYERAAKPLIDCVFDGGSATCFAYGQTGAGKTHTMLGSCDQPGLYLLAARDIFAASQSGQYGEGLRVWVSFFEIYCGQLFDLLNKRNRLHAREDGSQRVCIAGLTETQVTDVPSIVQVLEYGNMVRSKGSTGVNPDSSRSHAVLQVEVRMANDRRLGKMSFIDLAGSERAADVTDTDRQTRLEGAEINQSLLALKECIRSIDQDSRHTPFRQSKLTHILKDSFIGNSRTCMIANVSPTHSACENSLNTLRYADRVKELRKSNVRASSAIARTVLNVPSATPPSMFHPSNITCSSTPMKPQMIRKKAGKRSPPVPEFLDPRETPIRGNIHGGRRTRNREFTSRSSASVAPSSEIKSAIVHQTVPVDASGGFQDTENPTRSSSDSNPTLSDTCNLHVATGDGGEAPVIVQSGHLTSSDDTELDAAAQELDNLDEELNDLNKTGGKSGQGFPGLNPAIADPSIHQSHASSETDSVTQTSSTASSRHLGVQVASLNVTQDSHDADFIQTDPPCPRVDPMMYSSLLLSRDLPASKPKAPLLQPKPSFVDEIDLQGRESPDTDDMLFGDPGDSSSSRTVIGNIPATMLDNAGAVVHESLSQRAQAVKLVANSGGLLRSDSIPAASPAKSSDLTSFSRSGSVKLRAVHIPQEAVLPAADNTPAPKPIFTLRVNDAQEATIPKIITRNPEPTTSEDKDYVLQSTQASGNSGAPGFERKSTAIRREKSDPLLARHIARQNMPSPSEFLRHLTKQSWSKPAAPSPLVANIPMPRLPAAEKPEYSHPYQGQQRSVSPSSVRGRRSPGIQQDSNCRQQPGSLSDNSFIEETELKRAPSLGSIGSRGTPSPVPLESPKSKTSDGGSGPGSYSPIELARKPSTDSEARQRRRSRSGSREREARRLNAASPALSTRDSSQHGQPGLDGSVIVAVSNEIVETTEAKLENVHSGGDSSAMSTIKALEVSELAISGPAEDREPGFTTCPSQQLLSPHQLKSFSGFIGDIEIQNMGTDLLTQPSILSGVSEYPCATPYDVKSSVHDADSSSSSKLVNSAIRTEKLSVFSTGVGFSPIHPQPLTDSVVSKDVLHDRVNPLTASSSSTAVSSSTSGSIMRATTNLQRLATAGIPADLNDAKAHIVAAHEEQLAAITSLCKQEMKLLLAFKAGQKDFDEYVRRMGDVLSLKLRTINLLQDQLMEVHTVTSRRGSKITHRSSSQ